MKTLPRHRRIDNVGGTERRVMSAQTYREDFRVIEAAVGSERAERHRSLDHVIFEPPHLISVSELATIWSWSV